MIIYAGVEVDLQRLSSVNFIPHGQNTIDKPLGYEGSTNLGTVMHVSFSGIDH
ncbi:MAG: hypothetical protein ACR2KB_17315 [Chitinophagaceae bacterium]